MSALEQAIPEGYKQTEVGVIPDDWLESTVGSEFHMQLGKMLDENKNTGDVKILLGNRGVQWGKINTSDIGSVRLSPSELGKYRLNDGDILVCEGGEVGRCSIWHDELPECYFQKALHRLKPKRDYSPVLFINVMQWLAQKGGFQNFVTQTSIAHLPKDKFELVPLPVPSSLHEQTAIANALSDADALLMGLGNLIAKKQAIKTATMQQLLTGKTRLPQFVTYTEGAVKGKIKGQPKGKKTSELGEIPEDWDVVKFSEVCLSFKTGKLDANAMRNDGEYRFYTCARNHYYIDHYAFDTEALLVSGNGANVGYVHYFKGKFNAYQRTYVLSDFCADVKYLKIYLEEKLAERIRVEVNSGNTPYITMDTLTDMLVILPPSEEQTAIATILSDMDYEIQTLDQRLTKTRQIKQGMMQQLLTGRTRLPY